MVGTAGDVKAQPDAARDRVDQADPSRAGLELTALLDVDLEEAPDLVAEPGFAGQGVETEFGGRVGQRRLAGVAQPANASGLSSPAAMELPSVGRPKRAPSSPANATTRRPKSSPSRLRAASSAPTTPAAPS